MALRDRVVEQRQVIEAYRERDAQLAAMVRRLRYGGTSMSPMMGAMPASMLGGGLPGPGGGMASPLPAGMQLVSSLRSLNLSDPHPGGPQGPLGPGLGNLTAHSAQRDVAAAIIDEARRHGYSPHETVAILADGLCESGLRPGARSPNGLWHGIFQQDTSYAGRDDPNTNIAEYFNRLDRHGGPGSPDIWKSMFWLQQRPGEPSAEAAVAHGRQGYLSEMQAHLDEAVRLYRAVTSSAPPAPARTV